MAKAASDALSKTTVRDLLDAGLHFGHQTKRWNPKMRPYIFAKRNSIHIIDLVKSMALLKDSATFLADVVLSGKSVLFVGTKKQAQDVIKEAAQDCSQFYVTNRWLGGMLTNATTIRRNVRRMREIQKMVQDGQFESLPKKEVTRLRHELSKLERNLTGVANMSELPGAMMVVDIKREAIAVAEANRLNIPVVAIVDTNCDPDPIDYVIPANDDAIRAIRLITDVLAESVASAHAQYLKKVADAEKKRLAEEEAKRKAEEEAKAKAEAEATAKAEAEAKAKAKAAAEAKAAPSPAPAERKATPAPARTEPEAPAAPAKPAEATPDPAPAPEPAQTEDKSPAEAIVPAPQGDKAT